MVLMVVLVIVVAWPQQWPTSRIVSSRPIGSFAARSSPARPSGPPQDRASMVNRQGAFNVYWMEIEIRKVVGCFGCILERYGK